MSSNLRTYIPIFSAIVLSITGAMASVYVNFISSDEIRTKTISHADWENIQAEIKKTGNELDKIESVIEKISSPENVHLLSKIESLESSYNSLNDLFLSDQQKAVTLPLLKGEIEQQSQRLDFLSGQIASLSSSVQWLIALVFTSFAALIGVIATFLMKDRGPKNGTE